MNHVIQIQKHVTYADSAVRIFILTNLITNDTMILQIKNMESDRCIALVKSQLSYLGFSNYQVELGQVELNEPMSSEDFSSLVKLLKSAGFEFLENKEDRLIERIKEAIRQYIDCQEDISKINFSDYIRNSINFDYSTLSHLFSVKEGMTIEKYFIEQRIERVKKMLLNLEVTISEISFQMQFSSVGHLSNQFKRNTGYTPSVFRRHYSNIH